jgi:hypothetical protein
MKLLLILQNKHNLICAKSSAEMRKNMKVKKLIIIAICVLLVIAAIKLLKKDIWDENATLLKEMVLSIDETSDMVILSKVTPFEWDTVYSFTPYTSKEKIYETVGYKWDYINETVDEAMDQVVFLNDGKVVCYIYGYPSNNGYSVNFDDEEHNNGARVLDLDDDLNFNVTRSDGVVYLKQMK